MNDRRPLLRQGLAWPAYVISSALLLRPLLLTTIVADDLVNPFQQYTNGGAGFFRAIRYGWNGASDAGHFNYLGQIVGALYNVGWLGLASTIGVRFSTVYALTKLVVFLLCAEAAAAYLRAVATRAGFAVGRWRARLTTAAVLFSTLQLHVFWSNDPVGSYPLSGYAATALGFAYLCLVLDLDRHDGRARPAAVGIVGALCILYYEVNAAAVVSAALPSAWMALRPGEWPARIREGLRVAPAMVIPAVLTLVLQVRAAPESVNYSGTSVDVGGNVVDTFWVAFRSSLPGAGWTLTRRVMGGDQPFRWSAVLLVGLLALVVGGMLLRHGLGVARTSTPRSGRTLLWLAGAPIVFWVGATALQASTMKVQTEVTRVGDVYNFYAVGSTALAFTGALLVVVLGALPRARVLTAALLVGFAAFATLQLSANVALSRRFYDQTEPNRRLLVAYSEQRPEEYRCRALTDWTNGGWPEYYEVFMVEGLQATYDRFHGEPFCTGFVRQG